MTSTVSWNLGNSPPTRCQSPLPLGFATDIHHISVIVTIPATFANSWQGFLNMLCNVPELTKPMIQMYTCGLLIYYTENSRISSFIIIVMITHTLLKYIKFKYNSKFSLNFVPTLLSDWLSEYDCIAWIAIQVVFHTFYQFLIN